MKNNTYDFNYLGGYETQAQIDWNLKYNSRNIGSFEGHDNPNQPKVPVPKTTSFHPPPKMHH